ncbi:hypothetical protein COOONC_22918 [Cooperia oncophora]
MSIIPFDDIIERVNKLRLGSSKHISLRPPVVAEKAVHIENYLSRTHFINTERIIFFRFRGVGAGEISYEVGGEMPVGECAVLRDRPALRLDSRLVCKYEILSVIGKGSFSQVMRVQHRISRKYFAVKLVSSDCGSVNNELNILSRVSHPFVIRLEEVFKSSSKLFIVMEMASGGEMYERVVSKGRLENPDFLNTHTHLNIENLKAQPTLVG